MSEQKVYVPGVFIREHTFQSTGNTIVKLDVDAAKMIAFLNQHKDERGYVRFGMSRRQPNEKNLSHCLWLDTWKPDRQQGQQAPRAREQRPAAPAEPPASDKDDLPF